MISEVKKKRKKSEIKKIKEKRLTVTKISLLILILFLVNLYLLLGIWYDANSFTISVGEDAQDSGLIIYPNSKEPVEYYTELHLENKMKFFTDISESWLPKDIDTDTGKNDGDHSGRYYLAYTFYAQNASDIPIGYVAEITIKDVILNVDDAIRVAVYRNGKKTVYAKAKVDESTGESMIDKTTGKLVPEDGTEVFFDADKRIVMQEQNEDFKSGEIIRYTVVIWLEGNDQQCTNDIVKGYINLRMNFQEFHLEDNVLSEIERKSNS